ncbi:MAG TPA: VOC family protein [Chloroflexota bacterium]|nr:VOC family protein [Chloroflexota bacterium]
MSIQTNGFHHVGIRVTDLSRARAFYVDTLGFQPVLELPRLIIVNANGSLLGIQGNAPETAQGDRFDPFRVGLDHIGLGVGDVAELGRLKEQLDRSGVRNNGVEDDAVLGAKYISFYDPDGIALELYAMPAQPR